MFENQVKNLTDQLLLFLQNGLLFVPHTTKFANHLNPKKFNKNKTKLDIFVTQLNLKLQSNLDDFIKKSQYTKQNKWSYAIFCLKGDI